jgi:ABC-2 type transport system ATP-binding protein
MTRLTTPSIAEPDLDNCVVIEGLTHRYARAGAPALDDISLRIASGSTFGLLGPNGAGKSTLLSILTGILPPQSGRIEVAGRPLPRDLQYIRAISALVPQDYAFYPSLTGRENLQFFAGLYGLSRAQWRERLAQVSRICRLDEVLDKRAEHYSGGLKRRLNLAIGLLAAPQILYLDEPTVGIDAESRGYILEAIAQLKDTGVTLVYTSHYMEEVERLCDYVAVIDAGRVLVHDRVAALLNSQASKTLSIVFAEPPSPPTLDALRAWNVEFDRQAGPPMRVTLTAEAGQLAAVVGRLAADGVGIKQLQWGVSRLHDVYLRLLEDRS